MDELIPLTNSIRDALAAADLEFKVDLPQIAVVGGQSVGKSSLLECLVGRDFLPTGTGVTTRRPLILRLTNTAGSSDADWGEFQHLPGQRFESFDEIKDEIARDTDYVCGMGQVVSPTPLVLQIYSPRVLNLVLVDLPGVTRVPVGDQPEDIGEQIRKLVIDHVSAPSCLILAVVAGNTDLATADALAVAREVDPGGERTIGVVTKLDLAESSSEMLAILEGRVYHLPRGFTGVFCRSHREVQGGVSVEEHLKAEAAFFKEHPDYRRVANSHGVAYLAKHLNKILLQHICDALPEVKERVLQLISLRERELQAYGDAVSVQPHDQSAWLLNLFSKFTGLVGDTIDGRRSNQQCILPEQLIGRARIDFIFQDIFARTVQHFDCCDGLSDESICLAIRNAAGPRASLFMPEAAFEQLARRQIKKLEFPALQCVELVFEELQQVLQMSELLEFTRFATLGQRVLGLAREVLQQRLVSTSQMIKDLISIELAYVNTSHPDFVGGLSGSAAAAGGHGSRLPPSSQPTAIEGTGSFSAADQGAAGHAAGGGPAPPGNADGSPSAARSLPPRGHGTAEGDQAASRGQGQLAAVGQAGGASTSEASPIPDASGTGVGAFFSNLFRPGGVTATPAANKVVSAAAAGAPTAMPGPAPVTAAAASEAPLAIAAHGGAGAAVDAASGVGATGGPKLAPLPPCITAVSSAPSRRELIEVRIIRMLLDKYVSIVKKNIADSVPKTIMCFLVVDLKDAIQSECIAKLYKEHLFGELLGEARDIQIRRSKCKEQLAALYHALEVMDSTRG